MINKFKIKLTGKDVFMELPLDNVSHHDALCEYRKVLSDATQALKKGFKVELIKLQGDVVRKLEYPFVIAKKDIN